MPSGPEGDQELSEHTLMHPDFKKQTKDWILFSDLFFFFYPLFIFRLTRALIQVSFFPLVSFCIVVIYCTCNELVSIVTFGSRSFWV